MVARTYSSKRRRSQSQRHSAAGSARVLPPAGRSNSPASPACWRRRRCCWRWRPTTRMTRRSTTPPAPPPRTCSAPSGPMRPICCCNRWGWAAMVPVLVLMSWGAHLMGKRPLRHLWRRIALVPIAVLLAAIGLAAISVPPAWPLSGGAGRFRRRLAARTRGHGRSEHLGDRTVDGHSSPRLPQRASWDTRWRSRWNAGWRWPVPSCAGSHAEQFPPAWRPTGQCCSSTPNRLICLARAKPKAREEPSLNAPTEEPAASAARPLRLGWISSTRRCARASRPPAKPRQMRLELADQDYELPPLDLLSEPDPERQYRHRIDEDSLAQNAQLLDSVLDDFGVRGQIVKVRPGSGGDAVRNWNRPRAPSRAA